MELSEFILVINVTSGVNGCLIDTMCDVRGPLPNTYPADVQVGPQDLLRLVTVIEAKLSEAYKDGGAVCALKGKEAVKLCLSRIHVVHCTSCSGLTT